MTQRENVNPYPRKQKRREGKFPIKEKEKENFQSKEKKEAKKFPIKEWEKEKRKERIQGNRYQEYQSNPSTPVIVQCYMIQPYPLLDIYFLYSHY